MHDRGPVLDVGAWHVLQLQLHMLCLGPNCTTALFVSLSATRGARVYRVARDDGLLAGALTLLAAACDAHAFGAGCCTPGPDFGASLGSPGAHDALLAACIRSAARAELVADLHEERVCVAFTLSSIYLSISLSLSIYIYLTRSLTHIHTHTTSYTRSSLLFL